MGLPQDPDRVEAKPKDRLDHPGFGESVYSGEMPEEFADAPTGGTFRLTSNGRETADLPHDATPAQVDAELRKLG